MHVRVDYHTATHITPQLPSEGKSTLWQADMSMLCYFAFRKGGWPYLNAVQSLESNPPSGYMFANLVVIDRPDIGYKNRDHRKTMKQAAFDLDTSLTGFEIWRNRYSSQSR